MIHECPVCHDTTETRDDVGRDFALWCDGPTSKPKSHEPTQMLRRGFPPTAAKVEPPTDDVYSAKWADCSACHRRYWTGGRHYCIPTEADAPEAPATTRPAHYGGEANPFEPIKIIEAMGWGEAFCLGNAVKYLLRAEKKGGTEDLAKAEWYIRRVIDNRTREK